MNNDNRSPTTITVWPDGAWVAVELESSIPIAKGRFGDGQPPMFRDAAWQGEARRSARAALVEAAASAWVASYHDGSDPRLEVYHEEISWEEIARRLMR